MTDQTSADRLRCFIAIEHEEGATAETPVVPGIHTLTIGDLQAVLTERDQLDEKLAIAMRTVVEIASPTKQRPGDQPLPVGGRACVQDRLVDLIRERQQLGVQRYGQPLMTHNGRDALRDALEEAIDLTAYLCQLVMERDDRRAKGAPDA